MEWNQASSSQDEKQSSIHKRGILFQDHSYDTYICIKWGDPEIDFEM